MAIGKLQAARPHTPLFQFYQALFRVTGASGGPEGLSALRARNLKIEFPNFDASVVNLANPPMGIASAVQACSAPTVDAFNALPEHVRRSMVCICARVPTVSNWWSGRSPVMSRRQLTRIPRRQPAWRLGQCAPSA
jgi:hypothetical protein